MSTKMLEQKLAKLQQRVETLEAKAKPVTKGNWRDAIGMLKDDDLSREAARLGAEWRARENKRR